MAAEAGEILEGLEGAGEGGGFFGEAAGGEEQANAAWDQLSKDTKYFENFENFKVDGKSGEMTVKDGEGNEINLTDIGKDLGEGNYRDAFEKLGFDEKTLDDDSFQDFFKKSKANYDAQPGVQATENVAETQANGNKLTESLPEDVQDPPQNAAELEDRLSKVEGGDKTLDQMNERLKKIEANSKEGLPTKVGRWVKYTIAAGAVVGAGVGIGFLVDAINKHMHKMNGCWMVNLKTGDKCKIEVLTCNADNRSPEVFSSGEAQKCDMCDSYDNCQSAWKAGTPTFNPCVIGSKPKSICSNGKCSVTGLQGSKPDETCKTDSDCGDRPGKYVPNATDPSKACPNCEVCAVQCPGDASCSTQCNCGKFQCYPGYKLTCVNVDFWGAAEDYLGEPLKFGEATLKKVLMILLYIAIGIVAVFLLIKLIEFLAQRIKSRRKSGMRFG